jgi:hypothetical protein
MLAVATVGAAVLVGPAPASAAPTGCVVGTFGPPYIPYPAGTVFCNHNTGRYRAWADCWSDADRKRRYYGAWETGFTSTAKCNVTYRHLGAHGYST